MRTMPDSLRCLFSWRLQIWCINLWASGAISRRRSGSAFLRWGLIAWRYQAITWTNIDWSSKPSLCSMAFTRGQFNQKRKNLICYMSSQMILLKSLSHPQQPFYVCAPANRRRRYNVTLSLIGSAHTQKGVCAPANRRRRYNVTLSLISWAHTQNDPCIPQAHERSKWAHDVKTLALSIPMCIFPEVLHVPRQTPVSIHDCCTHRMTTEDSVSASHLSDIHILVDHGTSALH